MNKFTSIRTLSCALMFLVSTQTQARDTRFTANEQKLSFKENVGQVTDQYLAARNDIQFKMQAGSMNVYAGNGQLHYQWYGEGSGKDAIKTYRMDVALIDANTDAQVIKEEQQPGYDQFYHPHLGLSGAKAYSYNRVTYKNIYPNIDWVLYSKNNQLKYDFIVHPGGDPANIQLQYSGGMVSLNNGALTATTPMGTVTENKPYSYEAETSREIPSAFVLNGDVLSFNISPANKTIVIDPSVDWITYYGGAASGTDEWTQGIETDATGNVYVAGLTKATSNIATTGSFQSTIGGGADGYLVKLSAAGVRQWATYYGGSGYDVFSDVALDHSGNIYITGFGGSTGLATSGAYATTSTGGKDMILLKLDGSGGRQWCTYYYGSMNDNFPSQICCDPSGNVFINYVDASLSQYGSYVVKFLANGAPQWNNAWGSSTDRPTDITSDLSGNIYAAGYTQGFDGRFIRFDPNGMITMNKTITGPNLETLNGIATDAAGNIYISGMTSSPTGIATTGAYRTAITPWYTSGSYDGYLMKYNSSGTLQWGTYIGPPQGDTWYCKVTAGMPGKVYVTGGNITSGSSYFISEVNTTNGYQISSVDLPQGNFGQMWYSNTAWSPIGKLYMLGMTQSSTGFATAGAYQTTISGGEDPYIAAIRVDTAVNIHQPYNDTVLCAGQTLKLPYDVSFNFNAGNVFTAWLSDATGSFASPTNIGSITSSVADTISCTIPVATAPGTGYRIRITATNPVYISGDNDKNIRIDSAVIPTINVTASPGVNVGPWTPITFTANVSGAGSSPVYVWMKNGVVISGATGSTYIGVTNVDVMQGDTITAAVTSSLACASPATVTSAPLIITVNTGIGETEKEGIKIFPNPTSGTLHITGAANNAAAEIMNISGQVVFSADVRGGKADIELDKKLPNGLYLLRITSGGTAEMMKFNLQR